MGLQAVLRDQAATLEGLGRVVLPSSRSARRVIDHLRHQAELPPAAVRRALEESIYRSEDVPRNDPERPPPMKLRTDSTLFTDPRLRMSRRKEIADATRMLNASYRSKFTFHEPAMKTFLRDYVETMNDFECNEEEAQRIYLSFFHGSLRTLAERFIKDGGIANAVTGMYALFPTKKDDASSDAFRKKALRWQWDRTKPFMQQALTLYQHVLLGFPREHVSQIEYQATLIIENQLPKAALSKLNAEQQRYKHARRNKRMPYKLYLDKLDQILTELRLQPEEDDDSTHEPPPNRTTPKERRRVNQVLTAPVRAQAPDFRPQQIADILKKMQRESPRSPIHQGNDDDAELPDDYDEEAQEQAVAVTQALLQDTRNSQTRYNPYSQTRDSTPPLEHRVAQVLMNNAYQRSPEYGDRQSRNQTVSDPVVMPPTGTNNVKTRTPTPAPAWYLEDSIPVPEIVTDRETVLAATAAWTQAYRQAMQYYAAQMGAKVKAGTKTKISAPLPPAFPNVSLSGHDYYTTRIHPSQVHPGWKTGPSERPPEQPQGGTTTKMTPQQKHI